MDRCRPLFVVATACAALCLALCAPGAVRSVHATSRYEVVITLDNSSGAALTNHQVSFTFNSATPIGAGKLQASGNDIRVTDDAGTALPFAVQGGLNTGSTVVWAKIPSIAAGATTNLRLYYGDPGATNTGDPNAVFDYWEGFDDATTDFTTSCGDLVWSVNSGVLFLSWTTKGIFVASVPFALTPAYVAEASVLSASGRWPGLYWFKSASPYSYGLIYGTSSARISTLIEGTGNDRCAAHVWVSAQVPVASGVGIWGLAWPAYGSQIAEFPALADFTAADGDHQRDTTMQLGLGGISTGAGAMSLDWIRVRRYAASQPTTTAGTEHDACLLTPSLCDDGNACTTDACDPLTGCTHTTVTCNDNTVCTIDSCNPATGCVFTAVNCDDANACTADSCNAVTGCANVNTCNDGNACTTDACNPSTGCSHSTVVCDDGNACTANLCDVNAGCLFPTVSCNDSNACTLDTCDPSSGCIHTTLACDDHSVCTTDSCDTVTGCSFAPISCDDANACTTDACNAVTGCSHATVDCDDHTACTTDSCDAVTGCAHAVVDCDDHTACTTDSCDAVTGCAHAVVDCDDHTACTADSCDPVTGCAHVAVECDDHTACTTDSCDDVTGCGHVAVDCDDHTACTTDSCDAVTGCGHVAVDCDDHSVCTVDSCDAVTGCGHATIDCDDHDACTADSCDPVAGCRHTVVDCDDADACTTDSCDPAIGCAHATIACDDADVCTNDSCAPATGCVFTSIRCDDGDACTTDVCIDPTGCVSTPTDTADFPGLTCQLGWLETDLAAIRSNRSVSRWFGRRIRRTADTFDEARALAEGGDLVAARRRLRTARTVLNRFIRRADLLHQRGRLVEPGGSALRSRAYDVLVSVEALLELLGRR